MYVRHALCLSHSRCSAFVAAQSENSANAIPMRRYAAAGTATWRLPHGVGAGSMVVRVSGSLDRHLISHDIVSTRVQELLYENLGFLFTNCCSLFFDCARRPGTRDH